MRNKLSNGLWGLFFIFIGVGFAGNVMFDWKFNLFFEGWWTLFIIIPCFISMIKNGMGFGSTFGFVIGVLLLLSEYVDFDFDVWSLVVPFILIFIGFRIIFQNAFRKTPNFQTQNTDSVNAQGQTFTGGERQEYNAVFSGNKIRIDGDFVGASLSAVFAGLSLDLREAKINHDVEITAQAIFGGIDIYVPAGVKIKTNNVPIFGGVSNKTSNNTDPGAPTIYLNSTCMFGGIDIK